ncbi:carboxypeptidase B-like isoform X1 [Amphiura filiformis]|uniref:carboxypeptidase B-like isoform X1 n=1 Tax=Amphiura filiformis TaxID=82378 RepID=UPI003B21F8A2
MKLLCALLVFVASASAVKNYGGYQVLRVVPQDMEQLQRLHDLYNLLEDTVDFWKEPTRLNQPVDIMIGPNLVKDVKLELSRRDLDFSIYVEDVQTNINNERCTDCVNAKAGFNYNIYHTADEISQWVTDMATDYSIVTEINIGKSHEGRDIKAIKISSGGSKRVIYIQGGIHAREWISPATMMYMANEIVTNYGVDPAVTDMVDNYDWYIVPSLNVDGYAYSWTNDRMWRKNRQPAFSLPSCVGTDLNRNYPYKWGGIGASPNPCSETFYGDAPLSGRETSVVHKWLQRFSGNIALFIDFHNYSQLWLYPWGYTHDKDIRQPHKDLQHALAIKATDALKVPYGTEYFVGMSGPDMYPAAGASEDYGYATLRVSYSYIVELRDEGNYGFLIPESLIEPSGIETFEALKVLGNDPLPKGPPIPVV